MENLSYKEEIQGHRLQGIIFERFLEAHKLTSETNYNPISLGGGLLGEDGLIILDTSDLSDNFYVLGNFDVNSKLSVMINGIEVPKTDIYILCFPSL